MSEFETNPEAMKAELAGIYTELEALETKLGEVQDGILEDYGNEGIVKEIRDKQNQLKVRAYQLHLVLSDYEGIEDTLRRVIELDLEFAEITEMPVYRETVGDEAFVLEMTDFSSLDPRVQEIFRQLTEEYGLHTFEDEE